jgi:DNA (cytosine-5)-methyltransferase 1
MIEAVDLFCGAGGTSSGILKAAAKLLKVVRLWAVNHWRTAIDTGELNHPNVKHICQPVENIHPLDLIKSGWLHLLAASCECRFHSNARGGGPCDEQSRSQPWQLIRWATDIRVDNVLMENVREFLNWGPLLTKGIRWRGRYYKAKRPDPRRKGESFKAFINAWINLGYSVDFKVQDASDFGDATSRERLMMIAHRDGRPVVFPKPTHGPGRTQPHRAMRECIDWSLAGKSIFGRRNISPNTVRKINIGLERFGGEPFIMNLAHGKATSLRSVDEPVFTLTTAKGGELALVRPVNRCKPFLIKYNGTGIAYSLDEPIDTLTTKPRFALVQPSEDGSDILYRMIAVKEMAAAHSFPPTYQFTGNQADQTKQIGNSVPVELAAAHAEVVLK